MEFDPLNVVILVRKPGRPDRPATPRALPPLRQPRRRLRPEPAQERPDHAGRGARAWPWRSWTIQPGSVVWDIGAGSGSVAIEAARLSEPGMVYAIEQDAADYHLILANAETFGVRNLKAVHGTAPGVFAGLPVARRHLRRRRRPGGRRHPRGGLADACGRAAGWWSTLARWRHLGATHDVLRHLAQEVQALLINVARGVEQLESLRFESLNPTFLLSVGKPPA